MEKTEYKTSDLYISTVLIMKGAELLGFEEVKGSLIKQMVFVLTGNLDFQALVYDYADNKLEVNPKKFVETFKSLRDKMFTKKNTY